MHNIFMPGPYHPRREHTASGSDRATRKWIGRRKTTSCCMYLPYRVGNVDCIMPIVSPRRGPGRRPRRLKEGKNEPMRRLLTSGLALALAVLAVTTFARIPEAQTADRVLEACGPGKQQIKARALPAAVVDPGRCPVAGRTIVDGEVGSVVPPPGESVHAEVLTTTGAEELQVGRREDGTIELGFVGEDAEAGGSLAKADGPGECSDPEYTDGQRRVTEGSPLHYGINKGSTPSELRPGDAMVAIRRAGARVANTKSNCHMGDRVPAGLVYEGKTGQGANVDGLNCGANDGNSVVAFGDLPS